MLSNPYILVYGYGNPGRQDDAIGLILTEKIDKWSRDNNLPIYCEYNYQLNIEDSYKLKNFEIVIFIDSTISNKISNYNFIKANSSSEYDFSSHIIKPQYLLYLSENIFNHKIEAYIMEVRGYKWEFMQSPTKKAIKNIRLAETFLKKFLKEKIN